MWQFRIVGLAMLGLMALLSRVSLGFSDPPLPILLFLVCAGIGIVASIVGAVYEKIAWILCGFVLPGMVVSSFFFDEWPSPSLWILSLVLLLASIPLALRVEREIWEEDEMPSDTSRMLRRGEILLSILVVALSMWGMFEYETLKVPLVGIGILLGASLVQGTWWFINRPFIRT
ncbi:MAG: hypothetical protein AMXMBFR44_1480 [Candidatus Campbellbacteria bacterium]